MGFGLPRPFARVLLEEEIMQRDIEREGKIRKDIEDYVSSLSKHDREVFRETIDWPFIGAERKILEDRKEKAKVSRLARKAEDFSLGG